LASSSTRRSAGLWDRRFADADAVGLGLELETACLTAAITGSTGLPADG
jgi:hypothetical protein